MGHGSDVKDLAYRLWDEAGRPDGRDLDFWIQAETELTKPAAKAKTPAKAGKAPTKSK